MANLPSLPDEQVFATVGSATTSVQLGVGRAPARQDGTVLATIGIAAGIVRIGGFTLTWVIGGLIGGLVAGLL